jgi:hypothetical protein
MAHQRAESRREPLDSSLLGKMNVLSTKPWACSLSEINRAGEGFDGMKLFCLAIALALS